MRKSMLLNLCLVVATAASTAAAATIKVPQHTGSINTALLMAGPGGKVEVSTGTYHENVVFPFDNQTLDGDGKVLIDGGGSVGIDVPTAVSGARIEGVRVANCSTGIWVAGDNVVVDDCRVRDATTYGVVIYTASNVRLEDTNIKDVDLDGVYLGSSNSCVVEDCSIKRAGRRGIYVAGSFNSVLDSRIRITVDQGIQVGSNAEAALSCLIQGNDIRETGADGIEAQSLADSCTISENKVTETAADGIDIRWLSDNHLVTKNKVRDTLDNGIEVDGALANVTHNKVKFAHNDGIAVQSSGDNGYYFKNNVKFCLQDGFDIYGSGNTFSKNKGKFNFNFDRNTHVPVGANTYIDNTFVTSN